MSKLAHSNQETMDKIERDRRIEDGEIMVEPMTREQLVSELNRFRDLYVAAEAAAQAAQARIAEATDLVRQIHQQLKRGEATQGHGLIGNLRCILDHVSPEVPPCI